MPPLVLRKLHCFRCKAIIYSDKLPYNHRDFLGETNSNVSIKSIYYQQKNSLLPPVTGFGARQGLENAGLDRGAEPTERSDPDQPNMYKAASAGCWPPNPPPTLTTMTFPCFVLAKASSSYTYVDVHECEDDATVDTVILAAQALASVCHGWNMTHIEIQLYKVSLSLAFPSTFRTSSDAFAAPPVA